MQQQQQPQQQRWWWWWWWSVIERAWSLSLMSKSRERARCRRVAARILYVCVVDSVYVCFQWNAHTNQQHILIVYSYIHSVCVCVWTEASGMIKRIQCRWSTTTAVTIAGLASHSVIVIISRSDSNQLVTPLRYVIRAQQPENVDVVLARRRRRRPKRIHARCVWHNTFVWPPTEIYE